jgi:hypothetical protein
MGLEGQWIGGKFKVQYHLHESQSHCAVLYMQQHTTLCIILDLSHQHRKLPSLLKLALDYWMLDNITLSYIVFSG